MRRNPFSLLLNYKARLLFACTLVLLSNLLLILNPLIFRQALYALAPTGVTPQLAAPFFQTWMGSYFHKIYAWVSILLIVTLLSAYLKYHMRFIFLSISREAEYQVRDLLFSRIQMQSSSFFDRHQIGDLVSRLTNDITAYRDSLGPGVMYPAFFVTLIVPAFIALFSISIPLATLSLLPVLMIHVLNILIRVPLFRLSLKVQKQLSELSSMIHEHFSNIRILKSYLVENRALALFKDSCIAFRSLSFKLTCLQGIVLPSINFIIRLTSIALVFLAGTMILKEGAELSLPDFLSFMWIQSYVFSPLMMLGWILPMYQKGRAAYSRLIELYEEPIEVFHQLGGIAHIPPKADIVFNRLTFCYPGQHYRALKEFSLHLQGGTFVGITGPLGAGKSTLFRLLNRDYEVPDDAIHIGGRDIHDYSLDAFREAIVTVEQLPFLFSKTIADNLRFGKQEASPEEIEWGAKQAALHESVLEFSDRYETMVGERGMTLSGGQKQRVAIARAFLVNRSILLLDDVFSAVDAETEMNIFTAMKGSFQGKTVLLITHRVSILSQMDRVIYMLNGEVVEDGAPKELILKEGPYAALAGLQLDEK